MTPPIFGVVGWKNSGKTTLVARLIGELTARGYRVAAAKHAHHSFDIDQPGRDSYRFREAGARQVLLASAVRWATIHELHGAPEPSFEEMLAHVAPCDLLLVEGWKGGPFPKIEVRSGRTLTRAPLTKDDPRIVAIAADIDTDAEGLPLYGLDDVVDIADFIESRLGLARP